MDLSSNAGPIVFEKLKLMLSYYAYLIIDNHAHWSHAFRLPWLYANKVDTRIDDCTTMNVAPEKCVLGALNS